MEALSDIPGGPFDVILADPPWRFASNSDARPGRNPRRHYGCMALADIEALPVREIAAKDALLLMWVTVPFAELAFRVVHAWGFSYRSQVVWPKERAGTGYWARNRHEPLYICRRGRFPCPTDPRLFPDSIVPGAQREHSRKPDHIHLRVEAALPDTRKLEIFARERRVGWRAWGDEVDKFQPAEVSP